MKGKFNLFNKENLTKICAVGCTVIICTTTFTACNNSDTNTTSIVSMTDDDLSNLSFDELMQVLNEGLKKDNAMTIYSFLENFNGDLADSLYLKGDEDKKFQIPWDTAVAMVLAYNEFDMNEMYQMFDNYDLRANDLYKLVKGYTTMSIPAYIRLTNNTGIANLIQDQKSSEFYLKYENKLIEMNQARFKALESNADNDKNTFNAQAKAFNQMVRDDFLNDEGEVSFGSQENGYASGALASVVPIISAGMEITRSTATHLTDEEVKELNLDGYCNTIEATITNNVNNLKSVQASVASSNAISETTEPTTADIKKEEETTIDIKYEIIRAAAIKQLTKENKYFISDALSTLPVYDFTGKMAADLSTQAKTYVTTRTYKNKRGKTTSKVYKNRKDLEKDHPDLVDDAKKQEEKIKKQYEKENQEASKKAQAEANKKATKKSKENEAKADQEIKEKNTTARVQDSQGNKHEDYTVAQGNNGNVVVDDAHTTTDSKGNSGFNFDGPIYDEKGNIIAGCIGLFNFDALSTASKWIADSVSFIPDTPNKVFSKRF